MSGWLVLPWGRCPVPGARERGFSLLRDFLGDVEIGKIRLIWGTGEREWRWYQLMCSGDFLSVSLEYICTCMYLRT